MQCYIDVLFILYKWPLFQFSENRSTLRPYLIFSCIMTLISIVNEFVYSLYGLLHSNPAGFLNVL